MVIGMNFAVDRSHREFFFKHRFVEFEGLLSEEEADRLREAIFQTISNRLRKKPPLEESSAREVFLEGHNLFTDNKLVRKYVLRRNFAEIASSLLGIRPLRIAFDQFIYTRENESLFHEKEISKVLPNEISLHQMSSVEPVVCGCILNLAKQCSTAPAETFSIAQDMEMLIPIPSCPGHGIFFQVDAPISFESLYAVPNQNLLLIVYGKDKMLYTKNDRDPHVHQLKKLGYVFGDKLKNETHPIIYG
ncbi:MAG: hypothetical protein Tsb0015_12170 [Simkaniaceae bacterium]